MNVLKIHKMLYMRILCSRNTRLMRNAVEPMWGYFTIDRDCGI